MQRDLVTVERFYTEHASSLGLKLLAGAAGLKRIIREPTVNRPGLALAGFTKYFASKRVQVIGPKSHFTFKMLSESNLNGQVFRTGFAAGQKILDAVVRSSGLKLQAESEGLYYYARA